MTLSNYRDQRGSAMLVELVLVAAVLGFVGLAVYQSNHHTSPAAKASTPAPASSSAAGEASVLASEAVKDSVADAEISDQAEAAATDVSASDSDAANLEDTSNADF